MHNAIRIMAFFIAAAVGQAAFAQNCTASSGPRRGSLVELYTSEG